jgi:hypothetical protein
VGSDRLILNFLFLFVSRQKEKEIYFSNFFAEKSYNPARAGDPTKN